MEKNIKAEKDVKQTPEIQSPLHDENGRFAPGNPGGGRPKGSKNKFTKIKEAICDAFLDSNAAEVLKNTLVRKKRDMFGKLILDEDGNEILEVDKTHLSQIIAILPKDPLIVNEGDKHITYVWAGTKKRREHLAKRESDRQQAEGGSGDSVLSPGLPMGVDRESGEIQSQDHRT